MWTAIAAIAGLATTLIAYFINPGRRKTQELNKIFKELDSLYYRRDIALTNNDQESLAVIVDNIIRLKRRKEILMSNS